MANLPGERPATTRTSTRVSKAANIDMSAAEAAAAAASPGDLSQTLSGQDLNAAGALIDPDTAQLLEQFKALQPSPQEIPQGPGIMQTILAGLGAGLSGQPQLAGQFVQDEQARIDQIVEQNRQEAQRFQEQAFQLTLQGVQEKRRRAERGEDKQEQARQTKFENEMKLLKFELDGMRADSDRMFQMGRLSAEQRARVQDEISALFPDVLILAEQLDEQLKDPEAIAFQLRLPPSESNPQGVPFNDIASLRTTFRNIRDGVLEDIEDPQTRKSLARRFDAQFGLVEQRLKEFDRRQNIAARRPEAERRAKQAKVSGPAAKAKTGPTPSTPGGARQSRRGPQARR